jgi:serine/threonine protein phosphatase PrpC
MMNRDNPIQARVFCDQQMSDVQRFDFLGGQTVVFSDRCPGKTTANEDAMAMVPVDEKSGVLIVADGMGGHAGGEVAARTAIDEVVAAVHDASAAGVVVRSAIVDGFESANEKVLALGTGGGTTLSVVEIDGEYARPYHAGDSIILVVGSKGKIKLETTSHSPVGYGVEAGLLDAAEAMHHEDRHVVLNAIGSEAMRIDIGSPVKLAKRDTILLASDGLTDNLSIDEIASQVRVGRLQKSVQQLVQFCQRRMNSKEAPCKPDDLSVISFRRFGN